MTRHEWTRKIMNNLEKLNPPIHENFFNVIYKWWYFGNSFTQNYTRDSAMPLQYMSTVLRLSQEGLSAFKLSGEKFYEHPLSNIKKLDGGTIIGLGRIPSPYFISLNSKREMTTIYILEPEISMLMKMLDNDLFQLAQQFFRNESY